MLNQVRTLFAAPTFPDDEDKTRKAFYANAIAIAFFLLTTFYETGFRAMVQYRAVSIVDIMIFCLIVSCIVAWMLLRNGHVYFASLLLVIFTWAVINSIAGTGFGVQDSSFLMNFTVVLMAGLLLNWQASLIITVLSITSGIGLAYAQQNGLISHEAYPIISFARDLAFVFLFNVVIISLLIDGLEKALKKSRGSLEKLEVANADLSHTQNELQNLTGELTVANRQLENRTQKLRAIAEITATAASIHNFEKLVSLTASIISKQLGYYHVGVFLLDEQKQYAILRSASSENGLKLLSGGYRVQVGQHKGVVSFAAQTGQPQNALNPGSSELPDTKSELAFPLKSGNKIIGVLDLHSQALNAFSDDDISTLSILADQIGIAIQNAMLYEESERALREANSAFIQTSGQEWKGYAETLQAKGYRYDGIKPEPIREGNRVSRTDSVISIPVQLRGQIIGQLKLKPSDSSKQWTEDELAMAEATAERAALALEGARLLEEAQKRANREAFLSDMAAKLSTSFQLDSILRDTVEELGQTLSGSIVSFQLVNPSAPISMDSPNIGGKKSE